MLLIRKKESQIQDFWNCESKSNIKIWWWFVKKLNGDFRSVIVRGIFYRTAFTFKLFIFDVYNKFI